MRKEFADAVVRLAQNDERVLFLTGDLGFMALEKVREILGERFINVGVAEQNMASIAAGLAHEGFIPIIYSISPFVTLRPYEQIRNDICLHKLPVKIVANGGGYGYGIMGSSHHNIEDIGSMRILPDMKVFVPFTGSDVGAALEKMISDPMPNYLRLNLASNQPTAGFAQWRKLAAGADRRAVVVGTGSVVENLSKLPESVTGQLEVWLLSEFPVRELPAGLTEAITTTRKLITIEEHQGQCGMHETLASLLLKTLTVPIGYHTLYASGYPSGKYGSQAWHQEENSLGGNALLESLTEFLS
ncbi:MAG: transketolase [Chitinophagaceae bacterium]|nr:MAG: transketolase [Chitinophagaceae bacterium]